MIRLTTDTPDGNFETMLNFVYDKNGWAYIRHDGEWEEVPLTEWARAQCLKHGCDEFSAETSQKIDGEICDCMMDYPDCPIALAYCFASQACHLRSRLKMYEDVLFDSEGQEIVALEQLKELVVPPPNDSLSLEELREMDGEPVWLYFGPGCGEWILVRASENPNVTIFLVHKNGLEAPIDIAIKCGGRLYRKKPEEERREQGGLDSRDEQ